MIRFRLFLLGTLALIVACGAAHGAVTLKPTDLPGADGTIVATAFSPDSNRVAILRHLGNAGSSNAKHTIQIMDLKSGQDVSKIALPDGEPSDSVMIAHFVTYSFDGQYLLLTARGTDTLMILDAVSLQIVKRIVLHEDTRHRRTLPGPRGESFRGVVSLAVAAKASAFGVLTHDEQAGTNEIFIGSFSSGQITRSWMSGVGRIQTGLGQTSLSLSEDGLRTVVSLVPPTRDSLPQGFKNVRLYDSNSGKLITAIHTDGLVGPMAFVSDESILASRIDTPSLFSKKLCIEKWNLGTGKLMGQFCEKGHHVILLGVSRSSNLIVGFGCNIKKDIEGNIYSVAGRIDVWDSHSGTLVGYSQEMSRLTSADIQVSPNGLWLLADQKLFRIESSAESH